MSDNDHPLMECQPGCDGRDGVCNLMGACVCPCHQSWMPPQTDGASSTDEILLVAAPASRSQWSLSGELVDELQAVAEERMVSPTWLAERLLRLGLDNLPPLP